MDKRYHVLAENSQHHTSFDDLGEEVDSSSESMEEELNNRVNESEPSSTSNSEDDEMMVFDPRYCDECCPFNRYDELLAMLIDTQQDALQSEKNKTIIHRYKYAYDVNCLEILSQDQKAPEKITSSVFYTHIREKANENKDDCIAFLKTTTQGVLDRIPASYNALRKMSIIRKKGKKAAYRMRPFKASMLDDRSLRVLDNATKKMVIATPSELVQMLIADPPINFSYSIGFLGAIQEK